MLNSKFQILNSLLLALGGFLILSLSSVSAAEAPRISFDAPQGALALGSEFSVPIYIESTEPVNAIFANISYSQDILALKSINTASSVVDVWAQNPTIRTTGEILLEGGMREAFEGKDVLAVLIFEVRAAGTAQISLGEGTAYYADGLATAAEIKSTASFIAAAEDGERVPENPAEKDTTPPRFEEITVSQNPITGLPIIGFQARDDESGVRAAQARSRAWLFWGALEHIAGSSITPEKGVWAVEIQITDNQGNIAREIAYIQEEMLKKAIFLVVALLVVVWIIYRYFLKKKRNIIKT